MHAMRLIASWHTAGFGPSHNTFLCAALAMAAAACLARIREDLGTAFCMKHVQSITMTSLTDAAMKQGKRRNFSYFFSSCQLSRNMTGARVWWVFWAELNWPYGPMGQKSSKTTPSRCIYAKKLTNSVVFGVHCFVHGLWAQWHFFA